MRLAEMPPGDLETALPPLPPSRGAAPVVALAGSSRPRMTRAKGGVGRAALSRPHRTRAGRPRRKHGQGDLWRCPLYAILRGRTPKEVVGPSRRCSHLPSRAPQGFLRALRGRRAAGPCPAPSSWPCCPRLETSGVDGPARGGVGPSALLVAPPLRPLRLS
jgi:hypothetical protein